MTLQDTIENLARILVLDLQSRRQSYETQLSQIAERSAQVGRLLNEMSRRKGPTNINVANNTNQTYTINEQRGTPNLSHGNAINSNCNYGINTTSNLSGSSAGRDTTMNSTFTSGLTSKTPNSSTSGALDTDIPTTLDSTLFETNTMFSINDLTSTGNGTTSTNITSSTPGTSGNSSEYSEMTSTSISSGATNSTRNPMNSTTTPFTNTMNSSSLGETITNSTNNATTDSSMMTRNDTSQSPFSNSQYTSDSRNTPRYGNETTPSSHSESSGSRTIGEIRMPNMILPYCERNAFIECPTCHNCIHIVVDNTPESENVGSLPDNLSFRLRQIRGTHYSSPPRINDNFAHPDPRASTPIHMSPQTMSSFSNGGPALSTPLSHNNKDPMLNRMQITPLRSPQPAAPYPNINHPRITEIRRNPLPATIGHQDMLSSIPDSGNGRYQEQTPENSARARDTIRLNDGSYNNMQECDSTLADNFSALLPIFLRTVDVLAELRDYTRPINQR